MASLDAVLMGFAPMTISISLARPVVSLKVYDVLGREVATLVNGDVGPGRHDARWDANTAGGLYVHRLIADGHVTARRMLLL